MDNSVIVDWIHPAILATAELINKINALLILHILQSSHNVTDMDTQKVFTMMVTVSNQLVTQ